MIEVKQTRKEKKISGSKQSIDQLINWSMYLSIDQ